MLHSCTGLFVFIVSFNKQALHALLIGSTSNTFLFVIDIVVTTQFRDEYPRRCQDQSHETFLFSLNKLQIISC